MTDPRYARQVDGAWVAYASDYLSFVGADVHGRVAFAVHNDLGCDPQAQIRRAQSPALLQAEHAYAVLHDEHAGRVRLQGLQRYPQSEDDVSGCPTATGSTSSAPPTAAGASAAP